MVLNDQTNLQAMQEEPSSLQEPDNIKQIQIFNQTDTNYPVKNSGTDVITLYETGANVSCMSDACFVKLKDSP